MQVTLFREEDDASLRAIVSATPVPGAIRVATEREPSFLAGCAAMGPFHQVLVARGSRGDPVGLACRSTRRLLVNGAPEETGYLSQLRVLPGYRGRWLVPKGFRFLRELHEDGRVPGYLTTLVAGNREAEALLVSKPRSSLPRYRFLDDLVTLALMVPRVAKANSEEASPEELLARLERWGRSRTLFPEVTLSDLSGRGTFPGLSAADFVAVPGGVGAVWDQSAFRQTVVRGYGFPLGTLLPIVNAANRLRGRPVLPPVGARVPHAFAALVAVEEPAALPALLTGLLARARSRGFDWLMAGFSANDPALAFARRFPHVPYRSRRYTVAWEKGDAFHARFAGGPLHVEPGTL